jgi:medium-chain acyl-[acyl-carrier-protein] hydrolase
LIEDGVQYGQEGTRPNHMRFSSGSSLWLRYLGASGGTQPHIRLMCFPYAGAGASAFRGWAERLTAGVEVFAAQLPGREDRWSERGISSLPELTERLAAEIHPALSTPFAFFGHSMGAIIAFELARALHSRSGEMPIRLFVSGVRAPHLPDPFPPIRHLPDAAFIAALQRLRGIPSEVSSNKELLNMLLPALRADITLFETYAYRPGEPLRCPISSYGARKDPRVPPKAILDWRSHTTAGFQFRFFPGDHFFVLHARDSLLRVLNEELSTAAAPAAGHSR